MTALPQPGSSFAGHVWMVRRFGVRRWWNYRRAYRAGLVIDYAKAFTLAELAVLAEHHCPAPWEAPDAR